MTMTTGSLKSQRFYEQPGTKEQDGASMDLDLFGVKEDGPIRVELYRLHHDRSLSALSQAGSRLNLLECGCGGSPEMELLKLCSRYTGVDSSEIGLQSARAAFAGVDIPHDFRTAEVCALPFEDDSFDAAYSAQMIYHLEDLSAQEAALSELLRVVRPGGVVVIITANPRPLAFPMRLAKRMAADTPLFGSLLNRLRPKPFLPYRPMPIGWVRRQLERGGRVEVLAGGIPSTNFYQRVTEFKGVGKLLWNCVRWLDVNHPKLSAYLGNYVILSCKKPEQAGRAPKPSAS
jgi:SAM-dependent methyltransferase